MGSCTRRHFLLSTCFLQMISIIERQVFDFLGYMWAPIFVNFFHMLFVIFGFYGAYHFRIKYIVTYLLWNFLWIGWNSFIICFYLNLGVLNKDSDLLNLGTGSVSWFEVNGYGCKPTYPSNITSDDPFRPIRPELVDDCLIDYTLVEVIQSGVQCALALFGILGALFISYIFLDEDDRLMHVKKKSKHRQSLYSIEFGPSMETMRSRTDTILDFDDDHLPERESGELSPKPMTPRRVKRRSVMARGSNSRQSTTSRRSNHHHLGGSVNCSSKAVNNGTYSQSSIRNSRRKYQQNPVTKLLDQQQQQIRNHHHHIQPSQRSYQFGSFHNKDNLKLTETNLQNLNHEIIENTNHMIGSGNLTKSSTKLYHSFRKNLQPDPIYHNTNGQAGLYQQSYLTQSQSPTVSDGLHSPALTLTSTLTGHFNPTYQHSTTHLNEADNTDEVYNRPPSVRSSYSNFHGTRLSTAYIAGSPSENVFVGLTGANIAHNQHVSPETPPLYHEPPIHQQHRQKQQNHFQANPASQQHFSVLSTNLTNTSPQNISFAQRTASRESIRSMAFLNNGPPAYNLNYHTPPDSETTM